MNTIFAGNFGEMWGLLGITAAVLLGIYDILKKT